MADARRDISLPRRGPPSNIPLKSVYHSCREAAAPPGALSLPRAFGLPSPVRRCAAFATSLCSMRLTFCRIETNGETRDSQRASALQDPPRRVRRGHPRRSSGLQDHITPGRPQRATRRAHVPSRLARNPWRIGSRLPDASRAPARTSVYLAERFRTIRGRLDYTRLGQPRLNCSPFLRHHGTIAYPHCPKLPSAFTAATHRRAAAPLPAPAGPAGPSPR